MARKSLGTIKFLIYTFSYKKNTILYHGRFLFDLLTGESSPVSFSQNADELWQEQKLATVTYDHDTKEDILFFNGVEIDRGQNIILLSQ